MSIHFNTYVMIGAVFPYSAFAGKSDELDPWMDSYREGIKGKNGITVLYDGMGGGYVAIGKVLAKTQDHEGFYEPVFPEGDLSASELEEFGNVLELAKEHLTDFRIQPFVISHYR
jgi:hypothetical protein